MTQNDKYSFYTFLKPVIDYFTIFGDENNDFGIDNKNGKYSLNNIVFHFHMNNKRKRNFCNFIFL